MSSVMVGVICFEKGGLNIMKMLFRDDLKRLIEISENDLFSENSIKEIFDDYGDDWYIMDGEFQLTKQNEERKRLLKEVYRTDNEE